MEQSMECPALAETALTGYLGQIIAGRRARAGELKRAFDAQGYVLASSKRDPGYEILLTRNMDDEGPFRVSSFRDRQPIGHRVYNGLDGHTGALAEFAGDGWDIKTMAVRNAA